MGEETICKQDLWTKDPLGGITGLFNELALTSEWNQKKVQTKRVCTIYIAIYYWGVEHVLIEIPEISALSSYLFIQ